jgi:hypothetical protein
LSTGDFITFYDAGEDPINLSGDIANPLLFDISTNLTDTPAPGLSPTDNPTISNIRFTYIGVRTSATRIWVPSRSWTPLTATVPSTKTAQHTPVPAPSKVSALTSHLRLLPPRLSLPH